MIRHLTAAAFVLAVLAAAPAHAGTAANDTSLSAMKAQALKRHGLQGANGLKRNGVRGAKGLNLSRMLNGRQLNSMLNGKQLNGMLNGKNLSGLLNDPQIKGMLNGGQINGTSLQSVLGSSGLAGIELPR